MNAKRQLAVLVMASAAWMQVNAGQKPAKSAPPAAKPKATQKSAPAKAAKTAESKPATPTGKRDPFISLAVVRAQQVGAS